MLRCTAWRRGFARIPVRATLVGLAAPLASALLVNQWLRRVDAFLSKGWSTIAPQRQPSQPPPLASDRSGDCVGCVPLAADHRDAGTFIQRPAAHRVTPQTAAARHPDLVAALRHTR